MDNDETIFVGIPSYRDSGSLSLLNHFISLTLSSECQHTIADLLKKASNPEKVHVGVCFQCDGEEDKHCFESWPQEIFPGQVKQPVKLLFLVFFFCLSNLLCFSLFFFNLYF